MSNRGWSKMAHSWMKGRRKKEGEGPRNEMIFSDIVGAPMGRCGSDKHRARWSCAYMRLRSKWSLYLKALQLRSRMARSGKVPQARRLRKLDTPLHHCIRTDRLSILVQEYLKENPPKQSSPTVTRKSASMPAATTTRGTRMTTKTKPQYVQVPMNNPRLRKVMAKTIDHVRNRLAMKVARIPQSAEGQGAKQGQRRTKTRPRVKKLGSKELTMPEPRGPPVSIRLLMPHVTSKEWWPFRRRGRILRKNLILLIILVVFLLAPIIVFRIKGTMLCFGRKADCYMPTCKEVKEWQWQLRNCGPNMLEIDCKYRRLYYTPYDTYIYTSEPPVTKARHKYVKGMNTTCPDKMKVLVPTNNARNGTGSVTTSS